MSDFVTRDGGTGTTRLSRPMVFASAWIFLFVYIAAFIGGVVVGWGLSGL